MPQTILIVDDQDLMVRVLQATLQSLGVRLPAARTGAEALRFFTSEGVPDGIILDYNMPDQDGVETLRQIRRMPGGETVPVIMLTARDQTMIRAAAEGLRVSAFMTKPFSPSTLQSEVRAILANPGGTMGS